MQPRRKGTFHTGLSLFIFIEASDSVAGIVQPTAQYTYSPRQAIRLSGCTFTCATRRHARRWDDAMDNPYGT